MKKISFIPLLLISPLLFMGAVYPYARETPYEDYEISDLTFGEKDNGAYPYSLSISNTGEGYISLTDFRFDDGEYGNGYIEQIGDFFDSYLYLAPGGKCSLSGHSQVNMDPEKINYNCVAFCEYSINEYKSVTFTGMDEEDYYNGTSYNYYFNIEGYPQENDYYLTYLLEFTYDGVTYAKRFFGETFDLELTKEIDPAEDIEFSKLIVIQGRDRRKDHTDSMWTVIWVISAIIITTGGLISAAIVIPLISIRKPWRKDK